MTDRNRNSGSTGRPENEKGMKDRPESQREPVGGSPGSTGSGSDRSSSNIGNDRHSGSGTSGSREESMEGSARGGAGSKRGAYGSENLTEDDLAAGRGDKSGAMRGSSSGTTGLGGDRRQSSTGSPGGVEGVTDKSNPNPDEDRDRNR